MKIHGVYEAQIYIVLFIQHKRKTPTAIQFNHVVSGDFGVFLKEIIPTANQSAKQIN